MYAAVTELPSNSPSELYEFSEGEEWKLKVHHMMIWHKPQTAHVLADRFCGSGAWARRDWKYTTASSYHRISLTE